MKKVIKIVKGSPSQVGDGFFIRRPMPSGGVQLGELSPFLLLDHAGPTAIAPSDVPKGVDSHPHRGFETVTICYQGEIEHRDSYGGKGHIEEGGIQWMTAGSGVLHEEKHGKDFTKRGGTLEMIQLWVNLPAKHKMTDPNYQDITKAAIPVVNLDENGSYLRILAGEYQGQKGAASTFTPMQLWDLRLKKGATIDLAFEAGYHSGIYNLLGKCRLNAAAETLDTAELAVLENENSTVQLEALEDCTLLVLSGEPINEPIASYGPFVMNTAQEIREAVSDFHTGKMGVL